MVSLLFVDCPKNWTSIGGKCFYVSAEQIENTKKSYVESLEDCKIRQGRLYEPRDIATYISLIKYHIKVNVIYIFYCYALVDYMVSH